MIRHKNGKRKIIGGCMHKFVYQHALFLGQHAKSKSDIFYAHFIIGHQDFDTCAGTMVT